MNKPELELNRVYWDEATRFHLRGDLYRVKDFKSGEMKRVTGAARDIALLTPGTSCVPGQRTSRSRARRRPDCPITEG